MSLSLLNEIEHYRQLFMEVDFWRPYVIAALGKVGLPCGKVRGGIAGTYPTFIVDESYVIKFYGRLFDGEASYLAELHANRLVEQDASLPVPALVAQGALEENGADGAWHFLVFDYLEGVSAGEAWEQLSADNREEMARELGGIVRRLHALPLGADGYFQPSWDGFRSFLERQRGDCAERLRQAGEAPTWLLDQVEDYLMPVDELLVEGSPHLIHADLTRDHLLGKVKAGRWRTQGIIDFGDARVGDIFYELVALHLDLFQREKRLLKTFLRAYGMEMGAPGDFARRAMNMTLLHQFGAFILADLFQRSPELGRLGSLEALSLEVWG